MFKSEEIAIRMDGRGCAHDNIAVDRLRPSLKHENVYFNPNFS
jgi:hypothetical protein